MQLSNNPEHLALLCTCTTLCLLLGGGFYLLYQKPTKQVLPEPVHVVKLEFMSEPEPAPAVQAEPITMPSTEVAEAQEEETPVVKEEETPVEKVVTPQKVQVKPKPVAKPKKKPKPIKKVVAPPKKVMPPTPPTTSTTTSSTVKAPVAGTSNKPANTASSQRVLAKTSLNKLLARANALKEYPMRARRAGIEGICKLAITINTQGIVTHSTVQQKCGNHTLDSATEKLGTKLIGFKVHDGGAEQHIVMPIVYKLN